MTDDRDRRGGRIYLPAPRSLLNASTEWIFNPAGPA